MDIEKNFLPQYKLYECAVYDDNRPALSNIHFEGGYAFASNGYIAVRALITFISTGFPDQELSYLEGKSIDAKSFRTILTYPRVTITEKGFEVNDDETPLFFGFNRQQSLKFPAVDNLVDMARRNLVGGEALIAVGINVSYLSKLLKAMGTKRVRMDFDGNKGILVRNLDKPEYIDYVEGVLMPVCLE